MGRGRILLTTGFVVALVTSFGPGGHTTSGRPVASAGLPAPSTATVPPKTVLPTTAVAPSTTVSSTATTKPEATAGPIATAPDRHVARRTVLMVGDSISIDVEPYLKPAGVTVNGRVSRQFSTGIEVVEAIANAHRLPATLVVELGTNGTVTADQVDEMVRAARGADRIVFLTVHVPRSWEAGDNAVLAAAPARYPRLVALADWHALASNHPEWFTPDQVHLEPAGARAMAALVLAAVR